MDGAKKLSNIIDLSLEENSIDKLNKYLSSLSNSSEVFNAKTLSVLFNILKKHGKHEEKTLHVSCVLSCFQHFTSTVIEPQKWEKLSEDISKLFELVFVITSLYIMDELLMQNTLTLISATVDDVNNLSDNVLKFMAETLFTASLSETYSNDTKLLVLSLIGSLLQKSSRGIRTQILPSVINDLNGLSNSLLNCRDYETQVAVMEVLARCWTFIKGKQENSLFSDCPRIFEIFVKYSSNNFLNFDPECRLFLNEVNGSLGDKQMVYSVPCMIVCANDAMLKKPTDPAYKDFWVDFNLGAKSISFYYVVKDSDRWELMTIPAERIFNAVAKDSACQSKNGKQIEAVKIQLALNSDSESDVPERLKFYARKEMFSNKYKSILMQLIGENYEGRIRDTEHPRTDPVGSGGPQDLHKLNETLEEKSYMEISSNSKINLDKEMEDRKEDEMQPTKVHVSQRKRSSDNNQSSVINSDESDEEEFSRDSEKFSRYIKQDMLKDDKEININKSEENKEIGPEKKVFFECTTNKDSGTANEDETTTSICINVENDAITVTKDRPKIAKSPSKAGANMSAGSLHSLLESVREEQTNSIPRSNVKNKNPKKIENITELNNSSKKKLLYSVENSNIKDIIMSSQDDFSIEKSAEIPAYKLTKKEVVVKPVQNVNRANISFSYIKEKENEKSLTDGRTGASKRSKQQTLDFEDDTITSKYVSDKDCSEDSDNPASPTIFKSPANKAKLTLRQPANTCRKNIFFKRDEKELAVLDKMPLSSNSKDFLHEAMNSELSLFPRREDRSRKTYVRPKSKNPGRRARVMKLVSSDSDEEYVPPSKLLLENVKSKRPRRNSGFVDHVSREKIDPIRGDISTIHKMEIEAASDIEEPEMKRKNIVSELPILEEKVTGGIPLKIPKAKNVNAGKKKPVKQTAPKGKGKKKPDSKKTEKEKNCDNLLEKQDENGPNSLEVVNYDPPEATCDDLTLEMFTCDDFLQNSSMQNTFKISDMVQFGKMLTKEYQENMQKTSSLFQKEREMNFAAYDFETQGSYNVLYENCHKLETVTNNLAQVQSLLKTTQNLQKEIAGDLYSEILKFDRAKKEMMKNISKIEKRELSSVPGSFQGSHFKKTLMPFINRGDNKNALTN